MSFDKIQVVKISLLELQQKKGSVFFFDMVDDLKRQFGFDTPYYISGSIGDAADTQIIFDFCCQVDRSRTLLQENAENDWINTKEAVIPGYVENLVIISQPYFLLQVVRGADICESADGGIAD